MGMSDQWTTNDNDPGECTAIAPFGDNGIIDGRSLVTCT